VATTRTKQVMTMTHRSKPPTAHARLTLVHLEAEGDAQSIAGAIATTTRVLVGANRKEARERGAQCAHVLETVAEELARLELIAHITTDDLEAFSMAKGFVQRARAVLEARGR
jgi:hypothetical protein